MKRIVQVNVLLITVILMLCFLPGCKDKGLPVQPDGWKEKVNNQIIARVEVRDVMNCAVTRGPHVMCTVSEDTILCSAEVSFTDGSRKQYWNNNCPMCSTSVLIFDDGDFSYFYGWSH